MAWLWTLPKKMATVTHKIKPETHDFNVLQVGNVRLVWRALE